MMDVLLQTKFAIPTTRSSLVLRQRLLEKLQGVFESRLTLISAPAGFGKTTLLSAWAANCTHPVAWVSLDEGDNDPSRFLTYLITALELATRNEGRLHALLPALPPSPNEYYLTHLVNQLSTMITQARQEWVVVLDDYHLITNHVLHSALTFVLDHMPVGLHLVISTRSDPPLPLARLRARSQLNELRQDDLRFTLQESAEFITQVMKLNLDNDEIALLAERTEGWPVGLQLASVSLRSQEGAAEFITAFAGSHRFILDYLLEEVLNRQPEPIRSFLLHTSILEQLSAPLCQAVLGKDSFSVKAQESAQRAEISSTSAQAMLENLERANLFLIPLDNQRTWYRYHNLFSDFLSARLIQEQAGLIPELHERAAWWYHRNGIWDRAIKHALIGQNFDLAAEWIEQFAEEAIKRSQVVTLKAWLEALPESGLNRRPLLCIYHAWTLLLSGYNLESVQARLQKALEHGEAISGKVKVLSAFVATFQGDFALSLTQSHQALQELDEDDLFFRSIIAWVMGIREAWESDFRTGIQTLDRAVQMSTQSGNIMVAVLTMANQAELLTHLGQLSEAHRRYQQALRTAVDDQGRLLPIAGMAMIGLGDLLREWNDLEKAETHFLQGIELTEKWGKIGELDGYIGLARLRWAQGDLQSAHQALAQAWQVARSFDTTVWDDLLVQVYQAQLRIAHAELQHADDWMKARWPIDPLEYPQEKIEQELRTPLLTHIRQIEYVTLAWFWIEQGHPAKALDLLQRLIQPVSEQGKTGVLLQILLLQCMALQAQGQDRQAQAALEKALAIGQPEGFVRTFLDFGPRVHALIRQAAHQQPGSAYLSRLAAELEGEAQPAQGWSGQIPGPRIEAPGGALSERERQVLERMAAGLSNEEIAQELVIANSTIKTHVNHIFRKLEARTRTQAIARARELGLLE